MVIKTVTPYSTQAGKFCFCKMKKSLSFLTSIYSQGKVSNFMYREIWTNSCQCWKGLAVLKKRGMWLKLAKIIQSHYLLVLECFSWQLIKSAGFGSWSKIILEVTDDYGKRVTVMSLAYCEDFWKGAHSHKCLRHSKHGKGSPRRKAGWYGPLSADDRQWSCGNAETGLLSRVCDSPSLVVHTGPQATAESMWWHTQEIGTQGVNF